MGSSGMKRKGRKHLSKAGIGLSDAEQARVFGIFRWGAYSPAGALERDGFLARQVKRQRGSTRGRGWRTLAYASYAVALAWLVIAVVGFFVYLFVHLLG